MDTNPSSGAGILGEDVCWALLRTAPVGRLAVSVAGQPDLFPINFLVDHATIVFRTAEGSKLAATAISPKVAFEADGYDLEQGEAWSVVIKGRAEEIIRMYDLIESFRFPLFPWQPGPKHRFVRILPEQVSGRRFTIAVN